MSNLSSPRRRGAPLGNSNGFKHGLYSKQVKKRHPSADEAAVQHVNARLAAKQPSITQLLAAGMVGDLPPSAPQPHEERN